MTDIVSILACYRSGQISEAAMVEICRAWPEVERALRESSIATVKDAEWDAMDAEGRLPADWPERRARIEAQFADFTRDRAEDDAMVAEWEQSA